MINAILLQGQLSKEKLGQAMSEISSMCLCSKSLTIIIVSDGGDAVSAVEFVDLVRGLHLRCKVKIYEAASAAAYIALAVGGEREMAKKSILSLHRGEFILSPTRIDLDGKVDENLLVAFKKYDAALVEALKNAKIDDRTDELYASDWLHLSAEECLKRGIVQRLF